MMINFQRYLSLFVLIALGYAITGRLALYLAIPPGFASPIWPSSGIALAALVIYGKKYTPAVIVGSFLVNIWITYNISDGDLAFIGVVQSLLIGCGAGIQAFIGTYLIHRLLDDRDLMLETGRSILILSAICMLSGSFNAIFATYILYLFELVMKSQFLFNFLNWWVGDAIGMLILTPSILILASHKKFISKRRKLFIIIPMIVFLTVLTICFVKLRDFDDRKNNQVFIQKVSKFILTMQQTIINTKTGILAIKAFYDASTYVDRQEFRKFVQWNLTNLLLNHYNGYLKYHIKKRINI